MPCPASARLARWALRIAVVSGDVALSWVLRGGRRLRRVLCEHLPGSLGAHSAPYKAAHCPLLTSRHRLQCELPEPLGLAGVDQAHDRGEGGVLVGPED